MKTLRWMEEYEKGLKVIEDLNNLPKKIFIEGVTLTKYFIDTNLPEYSKHLISRNAIREVSCEYFGKLPLGKTISIGVSCNHYNIDGDLYSTMITEEEILHRLLKGEYDENL